MMKHVSAMADTCHAHALPCFAYAEGLNTGSTHCTPQRTHRACLTSLPCVTRTGVHQVTCILKYIDIAQAPRPTAPRPGASVSRYLMLVCTAITASKANANRIAYIDSSHLIPWPATIAGHVCAGHTKQNKTPLTRSTDRSHCQSTNHYQLVSQLKQSSAGPHTVTDIQLCAQYVGVAPVVAVVAAYGVAPVPVVVPTTFVPGGAGWPGSPTGSRRWMLLVG